MKTYMQKRRESNKLYALSKLGNRCNSCGSTKDLQFDHIDRTNKSMDLSDMFSHSITSISKELDKCQLLCIECHRQKTYIDLGYKRHGTLRSYRDKKCRCEECNGAWEDYKIKHAKRRRDLRRLKKYSTVS